MQWPKAFRPVLKELSEIFEGMNILPISCNLQIPKYQTLHFLFDV